MKLRRRFVGSLAMTLVLAMPGSFATAAEVDAESAEDGAHGEKAKHGKHSSRMSDEYIPLQLDGFPERPKLLVEVGNPYLGTGLIKPGVKLKTGAVWQPTLIFFGTLRTAAQTYDGGAVRTSELTTRLDLFANLQLTGTERLVVGFRNLDSGGRSSSYIFEPDPGQPGFPNADGDRSSFDSEIHTLYFEGDFGEIFPNLDERDFKRQDYGFSFGRQPLLFQDGFLINDSIDGLGLTRNTLLPRNISNFRATLFLGAGDIDHGPVKDDDARLYALLTSTDFRATTLDADLVYVEGEELPGDYLGFGVSAVQRLGRFATSFRLLGSRVSDDLADLETDGLLAFTEWSWVPHYTDDHAYFTLFATADEFISAARDVAVAGPLARAGVTFAGVGLGQYGSPLRGVAREVAGGAFGYQKFYGAAKRRQLLAEVGVRLGLASDVGDEAAVLLRYQKAVGRRFVLVFDSFVGRRESAIPGVADADLYGGRFEVVVKF